MRLSDAPETADGAAAPVRHNGEGEDTSPPADARAGAFDRAAALAGALTALRRGPRWTPDLAREIGRAPRDASDLIWAMCGLGLAVRVGPNVHAGAGYVGPALRHCPETGRIVPDPLAVRPPRDAAAEGGEVRERLLTFLDVPRAPWEVGGHLRLPAKRAARLLAMAVRLGLAAQPRRGLYVRADRLGADVPTHGAAGAPRRGGGGGDRGGLIRDQVLAFLAEPRSAGDVARHIGRAVPIATGHLAAMRRRGLVRRIGHAAYVLEPYDGPPLRWDARVGLLVPWTPPAGGAAFAAPFAAALGTVPAADGDDGRAEEDPHARP